LGSFQPSLRDYIIFSDDTQDCVLGYYQPSLRDFRGHFPQLLSLYLAGLPWIFSPTVRPVPFGTSADIFPQSVQPVPF
jgi:hypothetical protein